MDQPNEPLARRLRYAAIDRTADGAERVDDFVLDEDGVLDLRELDRDPSGTSVADPAKALATIRGQLGDAHEVSDLYDDSEPPRSRRWFGLRSQPDESVDVAPPTPEKPAEPPIPVSEPLPPLSRLSMAPLASENATPAGEDADVPDAGVLPAGPTDPEIDLRNEGRPTADCPKCMGLAHRDLFDRFSQIEFYSCDNCLHMWQQDVG